MNIEARLIGPEKAKQRRAELLADLGGAFAEGGRQAVTDEMVQRIGKLVDAFADKLQELKKQL
jgi:hypothetical protein